MENDFINRFSQYSDFELFEIISNSQKYQSEAVSAAQFLIQKRNLSIDEVKSLEEKTKLSELNKQSVPEKVEVFKKITKNLSGKILAFLVNSRFLNIALLVIHSYFIIFFAILIYARLIYSPFGFSSFFLLSLGDKYLLILPIILLLPAMYLFFKKRSSGWVLLTIYNLHIIGIAIGFEIVRLLDERTRELYEYNRNYTTWDPYFPVTGNIIILLVLYFLKGKYQINQKQIYITIGISTILIILVLKFIPTSLLASL